MIVLPPLHAAGFTLEHLVPHFSILSIPAAPLRPKHQEDISKATNRIIFTDQLWVSSSNSPLAVDCCSPGSDLVPGGPGCEDRWTSPECDGILSDMCWGRTRHTN